MASIYIAQLIIPLLLLLWLLVIVPRSFIGFAIQVIGSILILVALKHIGIWLFPPWWAPYLAVILIIMSASWRWLRLRPKRLLPEGVLEYSVTFLFLLLSGVSIFYGLQALTGTQLPAQTSVSLAWPLREGNFLVVNGGSNALINHHFKLKDTKNPRFIPWLGGAYALDIVAIDRYGLRASVFMPADPKRYYSFGIPLLAPCAGKILLTANGLPDMQVPKVDNLNLAGNHILFACGDTHILMAHLKMGSVLVKKGDAVNAGQVLGEIGNSGNSDEPHLHIHAQRLGTANAPFSGEPLPMTFDGRFLVRGDHIHLR